jgi:hypothetical protein
VQNRSWELSEGKAAAKALQRWMDEDNGSHRDERKKQLAQARQKTVVSQLRDFLANPDSAASTKAYLERYVAGTQPPDDELDLYWNTTISNMPPRSLIKQVLSGVDVEAELPDESGVPEGVMDYARLDFDKNFQSRLPAKLRAGGTGRDWGSDLCGGVGTGPQTRLTDCGQLCEEMRRSAVDRRFQTCIFAPTQGRMEGTQ